MLRKDSEIEMAVWPRIRGHIGDLIVLAIPIIIARLGWMVMQMTDTIMVGRFSTEELAFQSMAGNVVGILFVPSMGLLLGTLIIAANAYGEGNFEKCGAAWRRSVPYALLLGAALSIFCIFAPEVLALLNIEEKIATGAGTVAQVYGYAMPFGMLYIASMYFLEGIKRTLPGLLLMLVANILNIGLNWVLVYGHLGFPAMGAEGSAWATTIIRIVLIIAMVAYIWFMVDHEKFGVRLKPEGGWHAWVEQRRLGYSAGLSFGIEHGAFSAFFIFAAWLGEITIAAMNITFVVFGAFFMIAAGISSATGVRVGNAYGKKDAQDIKFSGWTGFGFTAVVLILPSFLLVFAPEFVGGLYSEDVVVIAAAVPLYMLSSGALILDGLQTVLANALRSRHDKWYPTGSHTLSYIFIMTPLAYYLAFPMGRGASGLMESFIFASVVSVALLSGRFIWLTREDRRRGTIVAPAYAEPPGHSLDLVPQPIASPVQKPGSSVH